jgi:hypothetical protein
VEQGRHVLQDGRRTRRRDPRLGAAAGCRTRHETRGIARGAAVLDARGEVIGGMEGIRRYGAVQQITLYGLFGTGASPRKMQATRVLADRDAVMPLDRQEASRGAL